MPDFIPSSAAIEARLAELKQEAGELRALLRLALKREGRQNGGGDKPTDPPKLPFKD